MAYKIIETVRAAEDLEGILEYIAGSLSNPAAAASFADEIERCYTNLEQMPKMYALCRDLRLRKLGYRKVVIKNYIMVYAVSETDQSVHILRFFYGRKDYEKLL